MVSDANAVRNLMTHGFAADLTDAGARAVTVGRRPGDGRSPTPRTRTCPRRCAAGRVDEEALDACVRRVLAAKLRLGLFEDPYVDEGRAREVLADPAHRDVARVAAERRAVLLRNEGGAAAAGRRGARLAWPCIGPLADSRRDTIGPWVFDFDLDETVTVARGHPRSGSATASGSSSPRACGPRSASSPRCSTCSAGNAPVDPEGFDDDAELRAAVDAGRAAPRSRSSSSASGRT